MKIRQENHYSFDKDQIFNDLQDAVDTENKNEENVIKEILQKRQIGENDEI